ncbi:hypothetical protein [Schaalia suimastitidis]|uniref:hypothetical protein n=1 Tax=Schaalia suimastitidis TaxID=121163 RepID=UPI001038AE46|nr:hypothetical protein [Schaalia suimastitidis]
MAFLEAATYALCAAAQVIAEADDHVDGEGLLVLNLIFVRVLNLILATVRVAFVSAVVCV